VYRHTGAAIPMTGGRDVWYHEAVVCTHSLIFIACPSLDQTELFVVFDTNRNVNDHIVHPNGWMLKILYLCYLLQVQ
jgi:hypothetical protein